VIFEQYYLGHRAHASYLIGDPESGEAAVVDPQRDVGRYIDTAEEEGVAVRHVLLTHVHSEFVTGHIELRERTDAVLYLGAAARADYEFVPLADGDRIELGSLRLGILETPGHTPESICVAVYLNAITPRPRALLTGGTLLIDGVGRPDPAAAEGYRLKELAGKLHDSLRERILPLPEETTVYPGRGPAGGNDLVGERFADLDDLKETNPGLRPISREAFIRRVTADVGPPPPYRSFIAAMNRREHVPLDASLRRGHRAIALEEVLNLQAAGATVVDVRTPDAFAAGHLAGSFFAGLEGDTAGWTGCLLGPNTPLVLRAEAGEEREAALRLGRIGFDHVVGYFGRDGGAPERSRAYARLGAEDLARALASSTPPLILDVRRADEPAGPFENALTLPLAELPRRMDEIPPQGPVVAVSDTGYRSTIAVSLLRAAGRGTATDLAGGLAAWNERGETRR